MKALMCTVVNRALPSLHGGSLEIMLTDPLSVSRRVFVLKRSKYVRLKIVCLFRRMSREDTIKNVSCLHSMSCK